MCIRDRVRPARPDHRLLRRQRPLRAGPVRAQPVRTRRRRRARGDRAERAVLGALRRLRRRAPALPRRRHPGRARRLQPLRQPAAPGLRRQPGRMRPGRLAMRKPLLAIGLVAAVVVVLLAGSTGSNGYLVRAIFDNGGFMVEGEEVRVAGATVGSIEAVDVTQPGEVDSVVDGERRAVPGKAVIVMRIDDPGFQDFRTDGSCLIRPQSLIGEKFVDCRPTVPRAPGSQPPPELREVPEGEPGEGQHLLPLENNSTSVDPDLINNINRLPYAQRFRLILNELGASLAGRGEDLQGAVERGNPVLRDTNRLFGILNRQRDRLAQLASDSDAILEPLARERASVAGFFRNSGAAAATVSLKSLGANGEEAGPKIRRADPVARKLRDVARTGAEPTTDLAEFLVSTDETGGFDGLVDLIYNSAAATNEYDSYGHFGRALPVLSNCVDYSQA